MNESQWEDLLRDLCKAAGIADEPRLLEHCELALDGMDVGLVHDETTAPSHCSLYYNLGAFEMTQELLAAALQHNLRANPADGSLCLSACASRLVYRANVALTQATEGAQLLEQLQFHHAAASRHASALRGD